MTVTSTTKSPSTVILEKIFDNEENFLKMRTNNAHMQTSVKRSMANYVVDALIRECAAHKDCENIMLLNGGFVPVKDSKAIRLTKDITCEVIGQTERTAGTTIKLKVYSYTKSAGEIGRWLEALHDKYIDSMELGLGNGLFTFNQIARDTNKNYCATAFGEQMNVDELKSALVASAPKHLSFSKTKFFSNKSFHNLYGKHMRKIEDRLEHFLTHPEWYHERGIPYQLTILLSGPPGTGKSSIVRAIANRAQRHIVNVAFHSILTATQLKNLTFNPYLEVFTDDNVQKNVDKFIVPLDKRITVFDEVDASSPLLRDRVNGSHMSTTRPANDELTLGDVLSTFEGSTEVPGSIKILLTNYPELLDRALKRPGRIDLNIAFDNSDAPNIAKVMFERFFDRSVPDDYNAQLQTLDLTPVEINDVFFNHFGENNDTIILQDLLVKNEQMASERIREQNERMDELKRLSAPEVINPNPSASTTGSKKPPFCWANL
jgi:hypothetical protein